MSLNVGQSKKAERAYLNWGEPSLGFPGKAMHPTLGWKIPWTGEPGGLQSMGSHRVGHDWSDLAAAGYVSEFCNILVIITSNGIQNSAAAKSLQSCPTLCDPIDSTPPAPSLSLGFSRQEHWSGLPFPSPTHESEKWKWSRSVLSDP